MFKSWMRLFYVAVLGLALSGCGGSKGTSPTTTGKDETKPTLTPTTSDSDVVIKKAPDETATNQAAASPKAPKASAPFSDADYLGGDVVGLVVLHPRRITEWAIYKSAKAAGLMDQFEKQAQEFRLQPEAIERVTLVIDQTTVNQSAGAAGLEVPQQAPSTQVAKTEARNNLKQVGLAFHNYYDTNNGLPRADGDRAGTKTGLSWRVQLLPFLDEQALYDEFHQDEPWDSEHNKSLIEKMPKVFATSGVDEVGKTSMHVIVDETTPFHGAKGIGFAEVLDGTSNTILAVVAGADTAEEWTKPGGLKLDLEAPRKLLGNFGNEFLAALCDGSVRSFKKSIDDQTLLSLVQMNDGKVVEIPTQNSRVVPNMIMTLAGPADRPELVKSFLDVADEEPFEGQTLFKNDDSALCFVDDKTVLTGTIDHVKSLIVAKKSGKPGSSKVLPLIDATADFAAAVDLKSQSSIVQQVSQGNAMLGLVQQIKSVALQLNLTGSAGDKLLELSVTGANAESAQGLAQLAEFGLAPGKQNAMETIDLIEEAEIRKIFQAIIRSAKVSVNEDRVELLVPVPVGYEKLPELLEPQLKQAAEAAKATKKNNNLRQIAIAFHNHHDIFTKFPGAGSTADGKAGLSWRVHLLPFLDQADLYHRFKLDEPWDSDTNKALIKEMPGIYQVEGVTEAGKTSLHVFTGPGALFADEARPTLVSITDGSSNSILAVVAGADTAEIWTKPGGLDFDPKDPIKALGMVGPMITLVLADGAVRPVPSSIKPDLLRKLIQIKDGETIEDF